MPMSAILLILVLAQTGVAPMSDAQQQQLATARDHTLMFDEAALYPLLQNVQVWENTTGLVPGATVPDFAGIANDPAASRGQLFIIEGLFQRARPIEQLARPIEGVTEYAIKVGSDHDPAVIVLLTDAPERPPLFGARIRTSARFFKMWDDIGLDNQRTSYPVFVGHNIEIISGTSAPNDTSRNGLFLLVLIAAGSYWILRRRIAAIKNGPRPLPSRVHRKLHHDVDGEIDAENDGEDDDAQSASHPLPADPADAMAELNRRHL